MLTLMGGTVTDVQDCPTKAEAIERSTDPGSPVARADTFLDDCGPCWNESSERLTAPGGDR